MARSKVESTLGRGLKLSLRARVAFFICVGPETALGFEYAPLNALPYPIAVDDEVLRVPEE